MQIKGVKADKRDVRVKKSVAQWLQRYVPTLNHCFLGME